MSGFGFDLILSGSGYSPRILGFQVVVLPDIIPSSDSVIKISVYNQITSIS